MTVGLPVGIRDILSRNRIVRLGISGVAQHGGIESTDLQALAVGSIWI